MTKGQFMDALAEGLIGISPAAREEILEDYRAHFADGLADGRSESEIAAALGDPARLARELRAQAGIKRWEEERSPSSALAMVLALLGLGAIDFLILLPLMIPALILLIVWMAVIVAFFCIGIAVIGGSMAGEIPDFRPDPAQGVLVGLALMAGSVSGAALESLVVIGLFAGLVWYARLHVKVLKP